MELGRLLLHVLQLLHVLLVLLLLIVMQLLLAVLLLMACATIWCLRYRMVVEGLGTWGNWNVMADSKWL
jgi:hypothetical protein